MSRLIDADEVKKHFPIMENDFGMVFNETLHRDLDKIPTVEAYTKEEVIDMFTELSDAIAELDCIVCDEVYELIQDRINALKGGTE